MRRVLAIGGIAVAVLVGLLLVLFVLTTILLVATGTAKLYTIPSSSMEPTMHCARPAPGCEARWSDRFAVFTRFVSHERGDIVVFEGPPEAEEKCGPGRTRVGRIVGLQGETLQTRVEDGAAFVYVDGRKLDEPYIDDERRDSGPEETFEVPGDSLFLMGDNRAQSCDSREFGSVPEADVVGDVTLTYWPPGRISIR